jgi:hypothetical protein
VIREADAQPSQYQSSKRRRVAVYAGVGAALWINSVAIAGLSAWYVVGSLVCGVVIGALDATTHHLRAGFYFVIPALVLAWWTTPRGDNDGLWLLIFPLLVALVVLVAGCHRLGAWIGRVVRALQAS